MPVKKILFPIVAISLALTGCGGGGSSDDDHKAHENELADGTRYYMLDYDFNEDNDNFSLSYEIVKNQRFVNSVYKKYLEEYVLTTNKLYVPNTAITEEIKLNSMTSWTYQWLGNIKTDFKLERVSLSGKNIFDVVMPAYRTLGFDSKNNYFEAKKLLDSYGKETFPNGSMCYRFVSKKANQAYFTFHTDDEFNQDFSEFDFQNQEYTGYLNGIFKDIGSIYRYESGAWQNIPWTTVYDIETGSSYFDTVAVKYNNKTYLAEYNSDIEWSSAKDIKQIEKILSITPKDFDTRELQLELAKLKNGCDIYNETAANKLASFRSIHWQ